MSSPNSIRFRRWIAGAAFVAAVASPLPATIVDDINPMDQSVLVTLSNPESHEVSGVVSVTSVVAGTNATFSAPFRADANGRIVVRVRFSGKVTQVLEVSVIADEPDPI